jgi:hypothetical protein
MRSEYQSRLGEKKNWAQDERNRKSAALLRLDFEAG